MINRPKHPTAQRSQKESPPNSPHQNSPPLPQNLIGRQSKNAPDHPKKTPPNRTHKNRPQNRPTALSQSPKHPRHRSQTQTAPNTTPSSILNYPLNLSQRYRRGRPESEKTSAEVVAAADTALAGAVAPLPAAASAPRTPVQGVVVVAFYAAFSWAASAIHRALLPATGKDRALSGVWLDRTRDND